MEKITTELVNEDEQQTSRLEVRYPVSGQVLRFEGRLRVGRIPGTDIFGGAILTEKEAIIIDPRCWVRDIDSGMTVYDPRDYVEHFADITKDWLKQHPDWPFVQKEPSYRTGKALITGAIDERLSRLDWFRPPDPQPDEVFDAVIVEHARSALRNGEMFIWNREMCLTLQTLAGTIPWNWRWEPSMLPTLEGYVHFERPIGLRHRESGGVLLTALAWTVGRYEDDGSHAALVYGFVREKRDGQTWSEEMFSGVAIDEQQDLQDVTVDQSQNAAGLAYALTVTIIFAAMATLLSQKIVVADSVKPERHVRRRAERARVDAATRLIHFRQVARQGGDDGSGEPVTVDWASRWIVSSHWRDQPYGPGRAMRRPTLIMPYIKGPESKPLKTETATRLFVVDR